MVSKKLKSRFPKDSSIIPNHAFPSKLDRSSSLDPTILESSSIYNKQTKLSFRPHLSKRKEFIRIKPTSVVLEIREMMKNKFDCGKTNSTVDCIRKVGSNLKTNFNFKRKKSTVLNPNTNTKTRSHTKSKRHQKQHC